MKKAKESSELQPTRTKLMKLEGLVYFGLALILLTAVFVFMSVPNNVTDINKATKALEEKDDYVITTYISLPTGEDAYIEVVNNGVSYTQHPETAEGLAVAYQEKTEQTSYYLTDYITADNKMYLFDGSTYYSVPDSYAGVCRKRDTMFIRTIIKSLMESENAKTFASMLTKDDIVDVNFGNKVESVQMYTGKIDGSAMREIMSTGSYKLYESIKDEARPKSGVYKLMNWFLQDVDTYLTYSDTEVTIGTVDGVLRYVSLGAGGLGSYMTMTKCIVFDDEERLTQPDFSTAIPYSTVFQEAADMCEDYDTAEEAFKAMSESSYSEETTEVQTEEVIESTEDEHNHDTTVNENSLSEETTN